jgi:hypothetical protein
MSESSAAAIGHAVETYTFARARPTGAGRVWRYVAADADVAIAGVTYRAALLTRGAIRRGDDGPKAALEIETTRDLPLVQQWLAEAGGRPDAPTAVVVQRAYVATPGDGTTPAVASDVTTLFTGTITGLTLSGATARLTAANVAAALDRSVPTVSILRQCPHTLYDFRCGIDPADFARAGTITARTAGGAWPRLTVAMDAASAPQYTGATTIVTVDPETGLPSSETVGTSDPDPTYVHGGTLAVIPASGPDAGRVVAAAGIVRATLAAWPTITVDVLRDDAAFVVGARVTLTAGCQRTIGVCRGRFLNGRRFGGFPQLPERDPLVDGML